jgi:hypothetical protein
LEGEKQTKRLRTRIQLKLPIRVRCKESLGYEWSEQSRLVDVTPFGAGFTLTRPTEPGRLLHIAMPLPHQLRCFDHSEPQYRVWSLVRHVTSLSAEQDSESRSFRVGVGFVGKRPPPTYDEDPTTRYEPLPIDGKQDTLWAVDERPPLNQRRATRLMIPLEVVIEAIDERGKPSVREQTVTETISSLGTCVPSNLDVDVGRLLRISSAHDHVSLFAAIRSRMLAPDGIPRLGLEFVGGRWPL